MGSDPEGRLVYGTSIGGPEDWKIHNLPDGHWLEDDDPVSEIEKRLRAEIAGFTETWETTDDRGGFHARERAADELIGVSVAWCGTWDYPAYVLAAKTISVEWSDTHLLDFDEMRIIEAESAGKVRAAVAALGIEPIQADPAWLLSAFYG